MTRYGGLSFLKSHSDLLVFELACWADSADWRGSDLWRLGEWLLFSSVWQASGFHGLRPRLLLCDMATLARAVLLLDRYDCMQVQTLGSAALVVVWWSGSCESRVDAKDVEARV